MVGVLLPKELSKVGNMVGGHGRQTIALSPCTKILGEGSLVALLRREHLVQKRALSNDANVWGKKACK